MSDARRSRGRTISTFVAILVCIGATIGACAVYHATGESCLKDSDCISGVCIDQVCGQPNPTLVGTMYPDDGGQVDSGSTTGADTGTTTPADSGEAEGKDSSSDGPPAADSGQRMMIDSGGSENDSGNATDAADDQDTRPPADSATPDSDLPNDSGDMNDASSGEDALLLFLAPGQRSV